MEHRDLPGNDASWYRALLVDQDQENGQRPTAPPTDEAQDDPEPPGVTTSEPTPPPPAVEQHETTAAELDTQPEDEQTDSDIVAEDTSEPSELISPEAEPATSEQAPMAPAPEGDLQTESDEPPHIAPVPPPETEDSPVDNTSEMVGQLWTAQEPDSPLDDWEPDAMDRKISSTRPFRWTSVGAALAVLGLVIIGLVLLPSVTRNRAQNHREMMTSALWDLRTELPDTQTSLATATDPDASVVALNDLSTQLTTLAAKASAVNTAGSEQLPTAPPFTSSSPIDELVPVQKRLEPLATTAQTIQRRISNVVEYRSLMSGFLVLPELPSEADSPTATDLRVRLASAQAASASILADLPADVSLSEHQEAARVLNDEFTAWQEEYLESLRTGSSVEAERLVAQLQGQLDNLDALLVIPLAQIRRQTDNDLIDLARAIDEVMAFAEGTTA